MMIQWDLYCVAALLVVVLGIGWSFYYEHFGR